MKRPALLSLPAAATLFLAAVAAQPNAAENTGPLAELMKRFDKDGDGKLDDAERAAAREAMIREGASLPPKQPETPGSGQQAFRARMLELFDRNKDGRLDEEERAAAQKFAAERGITGGAELREEILKRFDKNGNGRIDPEERAPVQQFLREKFAPPAAPKPPAVEADPIEDLVRVAVVANPEQLRRFDANGDGKLDDEEWSAARREIQRILSSAARRP